MRMRIFLSQARCKTLLQEQTAAQESLEDGTPMHRAGMGCHTWQICLALLDAFMSASTCRHVDEPSGGTGDNAPGGQAGEGAAGGH